jgi:hypothetical protein
MQQILRFGARSQRFGGDAKLSGGFHGLNIAYPP